MEENILEERFYDSTIANVIENSEEFTKKDWQKRANCYFYAINRYFINYESQSSSISNPDSNAFAHNPGYFAYGQVTDADTIENLVNNVKADLTALCGKDILVSTEKPVVKDGYHLIALRMGENEVKKDYHFMKYN